MGKVKKKNHRSRHRPVSSGNNSSRHNIDRDDDFIMHGVEHNNLASPNRRRGRGYGNNNRNKGQRDSGAPTQRNQLVSFNDNPFENLSLDESTYQDQQGLRSQRQLRNRNRNHTGNRNPQGHDNHLRHQGGSHNTPPANTGGAENYTQIQRRTYGKNTLPPSSPSLLPSLQSSSLAGLGRPRFCLECSGVRRANLMLRDWLSSALIRTSEVLDSWSDEVDVRVGSGDEMDWQPEPVVRVLILAINPATGLPYNAGAGWQQQSYGNAEHGGVTAMLPSWGNGETPANNSVSILGQGSVDQMTNKTCGGSTWAHNTTFGLESARMMTPPVTPPSLVA
ncbi:hypothetical protein GGR58DRAFT_41874 [Xylaria digitata]|nr:hypothetical protein GGR58DRAFT_41874 [Xylaria digitata]